MSSEPESGPGGDGVSDEAPAGSFARSAGRGYALSLASQGYRILLQVASVVILSRLLSPADFGLVAMAMAVIGIGELFRDLGLSGAAIQAPTLSRVQRDNLFWLNAASGLVCGLIACGLAPVIASIYREPALVGITLGLAPMFVFSGLGTQFRVSLVRDLRFQAITVVDMLSNTLALGGGVIIALAGGGYWALVAGPSISGLVGWFGYMVCARWLPRGFTRGVGTGSLVSLGGALLGSSVLHYLSSNADSFVVGYRFGSVDLGVYNRGSQLIRQPGRQYLSASGSVLAPILARLQDQPERLAAALVRAQSAVAYPLTVVIGFVIGAGGPVIHLFLGDQWGDAVPIIQWMALGILMRAVSPSVSQGLTAVGKGGALLKYSVFVELSTIVAIVVAAFWGPVVVAAVVALMQLLPWTWGFWWLRRQTGLEVRAMQLNGLTIVALGLWTAGGVYAAQALLGSLPLVAQVAISIVVALGCAALALVVPAVRREATSLVATARSAIRRS